MIVSPQRDLTWKDVAIGVAIMLVIGYASYNDISASLDSLRDAPLQTGFKLEMSDALGILVIIGFTTIIIYGGTMFR